MVRPTDKANERIEERHLLQMVEGEAEQKGSSPAIQYAGGNTACYGGDIDHNGGQIPLEDTHRLSGRAVLGKISCYHSPSQTHHLNGYTNPIVHSVLGNSYVTLAAAPPIILIGWTTLADKSHRTYTSCRSGHTPL